MNYLTCIAILANTLVATLSCFAQQNVQFKKHVLTTDFVSEGVATGDVNKDGKTDVLAGCYWFEAPDWKKHELAKEQIFKVKEYSYSFMNFSLDVNRDGWIDLVRFGHPGTAATWYENPKNKPGHWKEHALYHSVGNESPDFYDIDGDGSSDLLCADSKNKKVVWVSLPKNKKDTLWQEHIISSDSVMGTHQYTHGLGYGDVNLDGRKDVVIKDGWWEAPKDRKQTDWKFHKADLGEECAQMFVLDLDQDGDQDVISSSAHDYGIWWHEQVDPSTWKEHLISKDFSQTHGMVMTDINGDGHPDLITGKRYYAHNGGDPGAEEPAVLYWFEYVPGKEPKWIPHQVDDSSGAGLNSVVEDINKDKLKDIIIGSKKGVYVFERIK